MNKRNNRTAGLNWERCCIQKIRHLFPQAVSSRSESKSRDDEKIDIINKGEHLHGRLPITIQCKNVSKGVNYLEELTNMAAHPQPVIFHRYTEKAGKSGRFVPRGEFAILPLEDYIQLLNQVYGQKVDISHGCIEGSE